MDPKSFVYSAVLLLVVAAGAVALFRHFGLGSILGLLVAGVLIGPHTPGPSVTSHVEDLRHFTELGVVLLLFVIGLEMHPRRLWDMRRTLFGLGTVQILVSALALMLYFRLYVDTWAAALLIGLALALSSTALVMQVLYEQQEIATRHGQTAFSVLLMQDLAVVPMIAFLPLFAGTSPLPAGEALWQQALVVAGMLALLVLAGRVLVPWVLDRMARQYNREAFFLTVMAAVFVAAWAMEQAGMSMALGAFLMGMLLSGSRYSVQIQASVEPHKGLLMSLFFVAVGMSVDLGVLAAAPLTFALHLSVLIAIKVALIYGLCRWFGTGRAVAVRVAFLLGQAGEFGFVLFGAAKALGIIDDRVFAMAVAIISLSMLLTPLLNKLGNRLAGKAADDVDARFRYAPEAGSADAGTAAGKGPRVIIAGYGRVGHTIGAILAGHGIDYVAFDPNAALVAQWRNDGYPVFYGDIRDPHLLDAARIERAELVVLTIDNPQAAVEATGFIRARSAHVTIVARARDLTACDALYRAGANHAFPEAVEASLKLAAETLSALGISEGETEEMLTGARGEDYALVRSELEMLPTGAGQQTEAGDRQP
ncbi:MAG: cation:proton antiporter [Thiohalocapsa sp.]|uniref:cation:proton antiporter domain-containing protein n=1 Tax=Thiohalocapsa sp. TaxID=2497641 RepID=UPI0025D25081|nr:cation:proton antiporter [Thiohalocapsa sp.]MCG6941625.1 cation:proton antiporter [Thiohalocapsa sp.]